MSCLQLVVAEAKAAAQAAMQGVLTGQQQTTGHAYALMMTMTIPGQPGGLGGGLLPEAATPEAELAPGNAHSHINTLAMQCSVHLIAIYGRVEIARCEHFHIVTQVCCSWQTSRSMQARLPTIEA